MAGEPAAPRVPALDHEPGAIVDVACDGGIACIAFDDGSAIRVTPVATGIVRIAASPDGRWPARRPWAITSLSEPDRRRPARVLARGDGGVELEAAGLGVRVGDRGLVRVTRLDGSSLLDDGPKGGPSWDPESGASRWRSAMPAGRRYLGLGERTGPLDRRGRRLTCWTTDEWRHQGPQTDALYVPVPWLLQLDPDGRASGVFLDATARSTFDLGDLPGERLAIDLERGDLELLVIDGPSPRRAVRRLGTVTGRMRLPPAWAFGFQQARWSYAPAEQVRSLARRFRDERIPCTVIHVDIDRYAGGQTFTWDADAFPEPASLTAELRALGFHVVTIIDAGVKVDPSDDLYREGVRDGHFLRVDGGATEFRGYVWPGLCAFPDQLRPETRAWWGEKYVAERQLGVAGFVNDMNEPAMHDRPYEDARTANLDPPDALVAGPDDERVPHGEWRNVYAVQETRAADEALRAAFPEERPFLLTRAGFGGIQRYAGVWTGDNLSSWEHLAMSLPQLLGLGLSAIPLAGADVGGFFGDCSPELLVRWMQLGACYPLMRGNSAKGTAPQEPWAWGEPWTSRCRRAIELRSRLSPLLVTLAHAAARHGDPILRPMLLTDPAESRLHGIADQAMLGPDLLVAPALQPSIDARSVALPAGQWRDVRDGTWYEGGTTVVVPAGLDDDLPILQRGGSIVPWGTVRQRADDPAPGLTFDVALDGAGRAAGHVVEDDGWSTAAEDGVLAHTSIRAHAATTGEVDVRGVRRGPWDGGARDIRVVIAHASGEVRQGRVRAEGRFAIRL